MVYVWVVPPKKRDKYLTIRIEDRSVSMNIYLTEKEAIDLSHRLPEEITKALEEIRERIVRM